MSALWQLPAHAWIDRLARREVSVRESVDAQIARVGFVEGVRGAVEPFDAHGRRHGHGGERGARELEPR